MYKRELLIFFVILTIALVLRFYQLDSVPPGVNRDEASIGYTAYSLLQTGKDEYGRTLPVSFQSFGDWKLPLYMYTTTLFVSLFGLSEISVRILSILSGIGTVFATYFLVKELFDNKKLALLAMGLTAVAPWHIHLSRVESEANTGVFLTTLAVLFFLKSIKGAYSLFPLSASLFALTYFTYAGNYLFTTLLIAGILILYRSVLIKVFYRREVALGALLFFLLSGFIMYHNVFASKTKFSGISIFGDPAVVHTRIEQPRNEHEFPQNLFARVAHNRIVFAGERFAQNYLSAFSAEFLFIKGGGNKAHNISNFGNMYMVEAPFLFLGLIYLIAFMKGREKKLVLLWFFIAPIAASMTKDAPHTNRMFVIFPILPLVVAMGIQWSLTVLNNYKFPRPIAIGFIALLFLSNITIYLDRYFVHFPRNESENWGLGYKKLNDILSKEDFRNKSVIMARPEYSPYIFFLFYQKYDPRKYQETAVRYLPTEDGFVHVRKFDRYEFREIDWDKDTKVSNRLLIDWSVRVPGFAKSSYPTQEIILPTGLSLFTIIETK